MHRAGIPGIREVIGQGRGFSSRIEHEQQRSILFERSSGKSQCVK